jgi:hypothetical protein
MKETELSVLFNNPCQPTYLKSVPRGLSDYKPHTLTILVGLSGEPLHMCVLVGHASSIGNIRVVLADMILPCNFPLSCVHLLHNVHNICLWNPSVQDTVLYHTHHTLLASSDKNFKVLMLPNDLRFRRDIELALDYT